MRIWRVRGGSGEAGAAAEATMTGTRFLHICLYFFLSHLIIKTRGTVTLYGGSVIGRCGERAPLSVDETETMNLTLLGRYTDLENAILQLDLNDEEFSHFTICLGRDKSSVYVLPPMNLSVSVGIIGQFSSGEKPIIRCRRRHDRGGSYATIFYRSEAVYLEDLHFEHCSLPIGFEQVHNITVSNCSFTYFTEAVFDIFNCDYTSISDSVFQHNSGSGLFSDESRGNTGAVAIGFLNSSSSLTNVSIDITNTTFINNTAFSPSFVVALDQPVYPGRGGGLGVYISHSFKSVSVVIYNCTFRENRALVFGGGIFYLLAIDSLQHQLLIQDTVFDSNSGGDGASGMALVYVGRTSIDMGQPTVFNITGCHFMNHTATNGGGITLFPSYLGGAGTQMIISNTMFVNNKESETDPYSFGAALAISEINFFSERSTFPKHEIIDCLFVNNSGENGILNNGYAPIVFSGTNRFIGNKGTALKLVGGVVELMGVMEFINNIVTSGAALYFTSFAQARLHRGLHVIFDGNIGRLGASIFVDNPTFHLVSVNNPLCFFIYEDLTLPPDQWENVTITVIRNSALEGSALYIRRLQSCGWISASLPFTNTTGIVDWPIWDIRNNTNTGFEGDIKTDAASVSVETREVTVWPRQRFSVNLVVKDQFGLPTSVTAEFLFESDFYDDEKTEIVLQPELTAITSAEDFTQNFTCVTNTLGAEGNVQILNGLQSKAFQTAVTVLTSFKIELEQCPGGYIPMAIESSNGLWGCVCDSFLDNLIFCLDDQDTVIITSGMWASHGPPDSEGHNLKFYPCPPGYCSCVDDIVTDTSGTTCMYTFTNSDPDNQCICNRRGILCGECVNSSSVTTLLNHCTDCENGQSVFIFLLIVLDVVAFSVIVILNIPLPEWTYPFLFYIQMAPYAVQYFPISFDHIGQYLYFVASASSFYFVYDFCIYDGMTALGGAAIAYLPLLTASLTLLPITAIKLCISKRRGTLKHHGLWLIVLLSFSHVVYTSMTLLHCPSITDSNGTTTARWFFNGEVTCFSGVHSYLGVIAILVLLAAFLLILLPLGLTISSKSFKMEWMSKLRFILGFSYQDKYEWWASVELSRRVILMLVLLVFPRNTSAAILVLVVTLAIFGHFQPYKHLLTNIFEIFNLTVFIVLLSLRQTPFFIEEFFNFPGHDGGGSECSSNGISKGVATISWVLMPLHYLPLLVFAVLAVTLGPKDIAPLIKKRIRRLRERGEREVVQSPTIVTSQRYSASNRHTTYSSLRVSRGITHGVARVIKYRKKKLSRRNANLDDALSDPFIMEIVP